MTPAEEKEGGGTCRGEGRGWHLQRWRRGVAPRWEWEVAPAEERECVTALRCQQEES